MPDDIVDQTDPGGVVEDVADHGAGLAPVVVLGVLDVGGAGDVAVGLPAGHPPHLTNPRRRHHAEHRVTTPTKAPPAPSGAFSHPDHRQHR